MSTEAVTLDTCESEPIHIPGAIQSHGVLFACRGPELVVHHVSANAAAFFASAPEAILGASIDAIVDAASAAHLRALFLRTELREANPFRVVSAGGRAFDAVAHRSGDSFIVECEPAASDVATETVGGFDPRLRASVLRMQRAKTVRDLSQIAAEEVRRLTGFDRVMIYRFDEAANGEVVAECKRDDLSPFLGLHYPASDIPAQARRLYTVNWLRFIADVGSVPTPLLSYGPISPPSPPTPLDLSLSILRSVSPIHIQYLKNISVTASMSVSLIIDGELVGLIACHHYAGPRVVPVTVRDTSEYLGSTLSWQIGALEATARAERARDAQMHEAEVVHSVTVASEILDGLDTPALVAIAAAGGAAVVLTEGLRCIGEAPEPAQIHALVDWLKTNHPDVWSTNHLAAVFPAAQADPALWEKTAGGVLAVAVSRDLGEYILWFRPSLRQQVSWAGDPRKVLVHDEGKPPRLSPRGSFELWVETIDGRSLPWQTWHVEAASSLRRVILGGVRRRAAELRSVNDRLLEADRTKDDFLAVVSHELRTPLNAISGWTALLRKGGLSSPRFDHALDVISRNVDAQLELVEDLLDVSRITSGKLVLDFKPVDPSVLVRASIDGASLAIEAKGLSFDQSVDPEIGRIRGDASRLRQVVSNLVANAIKFTPSGGKITVRLQRVGDDAHLVVSDTGMGIDAAFLPDIFHSFRQHDAGMNRRSQGLGLGLSLVKTIVELHGGSILGESAGKGFGASFRVVLPIAPPDLVSASALEDVSPANLVASRSELTDLRILYVEDDDDAREILAHVLEDHGAIVTTAASAKVALEELASNRFDIAVSDVGMPEMDGLTMMRALRANPSSASRRVPAIALTAYTRAADRTAALHAGFHAHVPKPLVFDDLVAVIVSLMERSSAA